MIDDEELYKWAKGDINYKPGNIYYRPNAPWVNYTISISEDKPMRPFLAFLCRLLKAMLLAAVTVGLVGLFFCLIVKTKGLILIPVFIVVMLMLAYEIVGEC